MNQIGKRGLWFFCILTMLLVTWTYSALAQSNESSNHVFGHVFLFDVSGSMDQEWGSLANQGLTFRCLLNHKGVVRDEEKIIARGFTTENKPGGPSNPYRYWPRSGEELRYNNANRAEAAKLTINRIQVTHENTDLHSAWEAGRKEAEQSFNKTPAIIWMITDNWQDTGGDGMEEMDAFYASLQEDSTVAAVYLIPILRNTDGADENLVLYAILTSSLQSREWASRSLKLRLDNCLAALRQEEGLVKYAIRRIPCKFTAGATPQMEKGSIHFENTSDSPIDFEVEGRTLVFRDLNVDVPIDGKISFKMRSFLEEWSLKGAPLKPASFRFSPPRNGMLFKPPSCDRIISPPIIDSKPGEVAEATYEIRFFDDKSLFTPIRAKKSLRVFFPGSEDVIDGKMSLVISVDAARHIQIDDASLEALDGKIHLMAGIRRFIQGGRVSDESKIIDFPPAQYRMEFHVSTTVKVFGVPVGFFVIFLAIIVVTIVLVIGLIPRRVDLSVDDETLEEISVRPFGRGYRVQSDDTTIGVVSGKYFGGAVFKISTAGQTEPGTSKMHSIGRTPLSLSVLVKDVEYELKFTPALRG